MGDEFARFVREGMYTTYLDGLITTPASVTFDVGTFTGSSLVHLRSKVNGTLHGFEPIPSFAETAKKRVESLSNVYVHTIGLGADDEYKTLSVQHDETSEFKAVSDRTEVCVFRSFFNVWNALRLTQLDVLHMNVEGGEFPIFANLVRQSLLPKIRTIIVQFHYPEQFAETRDAIREELRKTHRCTYEYAFVWERWDLREE